MELMMHPSSPQGRGNFQTIGFEYDPATAHTVEVHREVNDNGELGSFGFTLLYEKPPIVGTIVPGGPADRAGLKRQDVVTAVNAQDTTELVHHDVVSIIANTVTPGVWLTVCEGPEDNTGHNQPTNNRFGRGHSTASMMNIAMIPQSMPDGGHGYSNDDVLPKYQDLHKYSQRVNQGGGGGGGGGLTTRAISSSMATIGTGISPLTRKALIKNAQQNGYSSSTLSSHHQSHKFPPQQQQHQPIQQRSSFTLQNGHLGPLGMSDQSLLSSSPKLLPTPSTMNFTSATVLVLYIGAVEIPEAWSSRELSSKCLQECTRNLLSQRQEFVEAFLEVTLHSMRILAVSQSVIYKHKREELYYAGVCSNDEQYFAIVTRKLEQKIGRKAFSASSTGKPMRAHMCHVFKVIQPKSVLILHSGDPKSVKNNKQQHHQLQQHKQKTIPITSCVTVVNAIQGLFTGSSIPGSKILDEITGTSGTEFVFSDGNPDKVQKKKLDVVDLRPSAYHSPPSSSLSRLISSDLNMSSGSHSNSNMYVSVQHGNSNSRGGSTSLAASHSRSYSNPAQTPPAIPSDYPLSIGTPVFHQRAKVLGGSGGSSGGLGGGGTSWYANDSPKAEHHSRSESWDGRASNFQVGEGEVGKSSSLGSSGRNCSGYHDLTRSLGGGVAQFNELKHCSSNSNSTMRGSNHSSLQSDKLKRFSDDSSMSSLSDSRASSPTKVSHRSSITSHSCSPSPNRSLGYSSRSRSPSPLPPVRKNVLPVPTSHHSYKATQVVGGVSSTTRRARMAVALSIRAAAALAANPTTPLRRQGSESSIMDLQELQNVGGIVKTSGTGFTPMGMGLMGKNGPLSSSIGSIATTIVDNAEDNLEECGRVGSWVASFDKLLADALGVHTLLQFLKKEHCEENILFWKDTQDFKEMAAQTKNLSAAVKKIYDEYLAPSSPNTVNIDDKAKKSIEACMANPPLDIFSEACEQIYLLMKMDCFPRFKKSALVKECLMAEMDGNPLPIDLPQNKAEEEQHFRKKRDFSFGRSLFSRLGRVRVQQDQPLIHAPPVAGGEGTHGIWGATELPKPDNTHNILESKKSRRVNKASTSPRLRKSNSTKAKRSSGGTSSGGSVSAESKGYSSPCSSPRDSNPPSILDDFAPEYHLNIFQTHMKNVFEMNFPNKVTKIMEVPPEGTVEQTIQPILKKHGYSLDIMELRYANNFKIINLKSPASILIGQHISLIKCKNTFVACFPDMMERILPANGKKTVGDLVIGILKDMAKLQNFSVAVEGARVSLDFDTDTSALIGQKVVIKYLPGPLNWKGMESPSKPSSSLMSPQGQRDMDDLFSMIERLSSDTLNNQRISPTINAAEQSASEQNCTNTSSDELNKVGEMRYRSQAENREGFSNNHHLPLSNSKSTDSLDCSSDATRYHQHQNHLHPPPSSTSSSRHTSRHNHRERRGEHQHRGTTHLRTMPPSSSSSSSSFSSDNHSHLGNIQFAKTQSGSSIQSRQSSQSFSSTSDPGSQHHQQKQHSSLSFPATVRSSREGQTISPPLSISKQTPLPTQTKKLSESLSMQPTSRWSGASFKSTDSASSEDSLTTDAPHHPKHYGHYHAEQQGLRDVRSFSAGTTHSRDRSHYFPKGHVPPSGTGPVSSNNIASVNMTDGSEPFQSEHPTHTLDGAVKDASGLSSSCNSSSNPGSLSVGDPVPRKSSWKPRTHACHPLQTSVSRGHSRSIGANLSSNNPWKGVNTLPVQKPQHQQQQQQKRVSAPQAATKRQEMTDISQLMEQGDSLAQHEIEEYNRLCRSRTSSSRSRSATPDVETFV